ncbi:hypothetical protein [Chlorogloeopsis sp. ULAP02]
MSVFCPSQLTLRWCDCTEDIGGSSSLSAATDLSRYREITK